MSDAASVLSRFQPADLQVPFERLTPDVRAALPALVRAMRCMDRLFMRQQGGDVLRLAGRFADDESAAARAFRLFKGPWNKLDEHRPLVPGVPPPAAGRGLYPDDLGAEELERFVAAHADRREALLDPYTVVVRRDGGLVAVPYHEAFADDLAPAAAALREAALLVRHEGLARFLRGRADALEGRADLRASDADWVRLRETPLEVVIGPFEVYEDGLRGVKAFYEGMLLQTDAAAGERLAGIEGGLADLAEAVPRPHGSRGAVGGMAPLVVADEIVATGEGHAGILAAAFNLPNDPGVRERVGWKQVLVRNVMRAKFEACTRPIAQRVLDPESLRHLQFDAFFHHVLLHEVVHGLGPAYRADGRSTNEACGRFHSALEEAKADSGALVLLLEFGGRHGIPAFAPEVVGASYLAGLYRSVRFGLEEAHGKANVVQFVFLLEHGALQVSPEGAVRVVGGRLRDAARALLARLCALQAAATPEQMEAFLLRYGTPPPALADGVRALSDLPVDILPRWPALPAG